MTHEPKMETAPQPQASTGVDASILVISDEVLRERVREAIAGVRHYAWWQRMLAAPLTSVIAAGLIGAWLTNFYDHQRLKTENELIKNRAVAERIETQREVEIARAFSTFEDVSKLLDKRLWRARRLVWAVDEKVSDAELERRWVAYRETVNEWNENLNGNLARVERYFGSGARGKLEGAIADGLRAVNTELKGPNLSSRNLHARIDDLNNNIYAFNLSLLEMVETGNVGAFRHDT
jgi:hypothetical protein